MIDPETGLYLLEPNWPGVKVLKSVESDMLKSLYGSPEILPPSPYNCPVCKRNVVGKDSLGEEITSFRFYRDGDPSNEVVEYRCDCVSQWILYRFFLYNGVARGAQRLGIKDLREEHRGFLVQHIAELKNRASDGIGFYLWGSQGTGKTLMAVLMLKAALASGISGHFASFLDLVDNAGVKSEATEEQRAWFVGKTKNAGLLVVDDPGNEQSSSDRAVEYYSSVMDEIVRYRMSASLPTIITSNLSPESFRQRYGSNVASLMGEKMIEKHVTGTDFRGNHMSLNLEETRKGISRPFVVM